MSIPHCLALYFYGAEQLPLTPASTKLLTNPLCASTRTSIASNASWARSSVEDNPASRSNYSRKPRKPWRRARLLAVGSGFLHQPLESKQSNLPFCVSCWCLLVAIYAVTARKIGNKAVLNTTWDTLLETSPSYWHLSIASDTSSRILWETTAFATPVEVDNRLTHS